MKNSLKKYFKSVQPSGNKDTVVLELPKKIKISHWNINGIRAIFKRGDLSDYIKKSNCDIYLFNETKIDSDTLKKETALLNFFKENKYFYCNNSADRPGYSGVLAIYKCQPLNIFRNFEIIKNGKLEELYASDKEGRILTLEYDNFFLINTYVPNAQGKLVRLKYRQEWNLKLKTYANELKKTKKVIIAGDLNVAHNEIDLKNPKTNEFSPGFSKEERSDFTELLNSGFTDIFRKNNPTKVQYSWWSARSNARVKGIGWRIDYFLTSEYKQEDEITIRDDVYGSDHCPVELILNN